MLCADLGTGPRLACPAGLGALYPVLQRAEALPNHRDLFRTQPFGAAAQDAPAACHERFDYPRVVAGRGNIVQRAQQPQADGDIRGRLMANLLEGRIEQTVGPDPGHDDPHDVRRSA